MTAYATLLDVYALGLSSAAMGQITAAQQQAILDSENAQADSYLRGRYQLPLLAWDQDLKLAVAQRTAWRILCLRGFNPESGADVSIRQGYDDATRWLEGIQRGSSHPNVTPSAPATPGTAYAQPQAMSANVPRGWR
jgi:phage gp36-like protein